MSPEDVAGEEVTGYMLGRSIPAIHRLKKTTIVFCGCGKVAIIRIFWTTNKPGRRFYGCQEQGSSCQFIGWFDPPMCQRAVDIIHGLLRSKNRIEDELKAIRLRCRRVKIYLFITWIGVVVYVMFSL